MGKFLRVLVVFIFMLSIAALTFAILLFNKREILKGRTHELEQGLIKISRTIEAEPPAVPEDPTKYVERDISDCTAEPLDQPQLSTFWNTYKQQLESLDQKMLDIKKRERDLMSYYKIDPATGKAERDPTTGLKITKGPGTTQGVIDDILKRAEAQFDLLTETRQQLEEIRMELVDTIKELNGRKVTLREKLAKIVDLNKQVMELNRTITNLRQQIEEQQNQIQSLESDVANLEQEKRKLEEDNEGLKIAKEELKDTIKDLRGQIDRLNQTTEGGEPNLTGNVIEVARLNIKPGVKGTIASVDQEHQFVVFKTDQKFIDDLLAVTTKGTLPYIPLIVKRGDNQFISKIKVKQLDQDKKLIIGDIMIDWQQAPIKVGDTVYYQ